MFAAFVCDQTNCWYSRSWRQLELSEIGDGVVVVPQARCVCSPELEMRLVQLNGKIVSDGA